MSKGSSEEWKRVSTLVDLLRFRATHQSDSAVYQFLPDGEVETAAFTYAGLDRAARAVATLLQSLNCEGKPVLLLYPPGLDYVAAFFGCVYAGAIAVPAYPPRPNRSLERLQIMIRDAEAHVALTHSNVLKGLERRFADSPILKALQWLATDVLEAGLAKSWQAPPIAADTLALLQYTSGSTGTPKGVKVSHGNLLHNSARIAKFFGHTEASRGVSWLPPYHDMGLVGGILQAVYAGIAITLLPPVAFLQKPLRWLQVISRYRATSSGGPNFAYDLCVNKTTPEQRASLDLSSWQVAFSGAEPVRADTLDRFSEAFAAAGFRREAFYPCYGMAETTLILTGGDPQVAPQVHQVDEDALRSQQLALPTTEAGRAIVSCGQPSADQTVLIVDPDTHTPLHDSQVGEIWVAASGSVTHGYWNRPQQTAETFQAYTTDGEGPFLRTGDLGFLQAGELFVTGRRKELIIIRGRNYYPKDIEATVEAAHESLRADAGAAFSVTVDGQERLVVVQEVERTHLRSLPTEEVVSAVRRAIAEQHDLQLYGLQLIKTGSIPKTSSGKIQRLFCRAGYLDHQLAAVHTWQLESWDRETDMAGAPSASSPGVAAPPAATTTPLTSPILESPEALRQWLTDWLAQQIQMPAADIEITRPFAEYGLDSVAAVELTEALQTTLQRPLSPTLAYEYPTIEAVAAYLSSQGEPDSPDPPETAALKTEEDDLADILTELDDLSAAEVEELLGQQGR